VSLRSERIRYVLYATVVCALLIAPLGCGGGGGGGGGAASSVSGTVRNDGTLAGVAGAAVALVSDPTKNAVTAADGTFTIADMPTGNVALTVTKAGFVATTFAEALVSGANNVGSLYLPPTLTAGNGAVSGRVEDGTGIVANALLSAAGVGGAAKGDGTFTVYNVPAGLQTLWATSPDKNSSGSKTVTITAGSVLSGQLVLISPGPPPPPIFG
jgi:hypothetical protein